jgi:multiple sugar transport system ATP-binding protein
MAQVSLENVTKHFGKVVAVDDLTLQVHDKEFLVLVGPSGCGKTTTLRMIAGLDEITSGTISIGDRCVNKVSPKDRDIAMVFQSYALYPHMNVYNNMAFGLKLRHTPRQEIQERVSEAARILEIEPLLKRKPRELSGGQRQRVALGRAIVRHPAVFLMDEPLSNLDAMLRVQTRKELISLHRRLEATVIYVTHDQTEALTMGSRIAVMNGGVLLQVATPADLYNFPVNTFVAGFIGSPQMNLITGSISRDAGKTVFQSPGLVLPLPPGLAVEAATSVVLGIRPEHVSFTSGGGDEAILGSVDVVEHMGAELYVYVTIGDGAALTARVNAKTLYAPGENVQLSLDPSNLHLFDGVTGHAIAHSATQPAAA